MMGLHPTSITIPGMNLRDERRRAVVEEGKCLLLAEQLRLLDVKKEEIRALRERGGGSFFYGEALANDLVGIRLVLCAALLSQGLDEAERDELERREREARELLDMATNARVVRARHENHS